MQAALLFGAVALIASFVLAPVQAQSTGKLTGIVTDAATGEPLPGANVVLGGTTLGTATDVDGNYVLIGVPVGTYDVQASFVGYQTATVENVEINAGYTREIDFSLQEGAQLEEVVVEYERPLIQKDAIGAVRSVTSEEIENLPVRGAAGVASLQSGVVKNEGSNDLFVRGGREEQVVYFVDGVKVIGGVNSLGVPQQAIQEQESLIGTIPARYGDAMSGVISITTKSGSPNFFGSVEAITSEVLDGYGYNLFSGTIGGPIVPRKLSFFASGQVELQADRSPFAVDVPEISDDLLDDLWARPQALPVEDGEGNRRYVPLPPDIADGTYDQIASQLGLAEGDTIVSFSPVNRPNVIDLGQIDMVSSKDLPNQQYDFTGNLTFTPTSNTYLRLGGTFAYRDLETYNYGRQLYARNRTYRDEEQNYRAYATWRQYLSNSTFYQVQVDFTDDKGWQYPEQFSRDVEETVNYIDIDHPTNSTLASYLGTGSVVGETEDGQPIYGFDRRSGISDGTTSAGVVAPSTFTLPGVALGFYEQFHNRQFRLSASASTQVGVHQIEFGGEFEQRTNRFYQLNGDTDDIARWICDDPEAANCGAESSDPGRDIFGAETYSDLPYRALQGAFYYGYDFRGQNEVDDQDIAAFIEAGLSGEDSDYNVAPYQPIYYGGYVQDKIEFRDLVINLGLRVDVFDNNTEVLRDPFALAPIVRAGDLSGVDVPGNVSDDFAVYFAGEDVVGYRDLDGEFFDAAGQDITFGDIQAAGGRPQQVEGTDSFDPAIFTDYEPEVTLMPRVGVSFPVTNQALFFASYNVTAQRPTEFAFTPFPTYRALTAQNRISNPALEPQKTIQYELGFRQSIGARAALQISGFYRKMEDLIQVRDLPQVFPSGVQSFQNVDFAVVKGAELQFDLRRTRGVSLRANYTLSFAQGTGGDAQSLGVIAWRSSMGGFTPRFIFPTEFDRRHVLNVTADYRLGEGEGPMVGGAYPLSNFGVNVVANLGSGMPYTKLKDDQVFRIVESFTDDVEGGLNEARLPWTGVLDLRVDRRFTLGGSSSLTAFLWVQNLLDSDGVLGVYRVSGEPDTDLFINSDEGVQRAQDFASGLDDARAADVFRYHYSQYADAPNALGGNHYTGGPRYVLPRRVRLGVRLNF